MKIINRNTVVFIIGIIIACGCNTYRLEKYISPKPTDWTMYGGSISRKNQSNQSLIPPLQLQWKYDAGAGFSKSSGVIADNVLFSTNLIGELHLINIQMGKKIGKKKFSSPIVGSPALGPGVLYIPFSSNEISIGEYDLSNNNFKWVLQLAEIESSPLLVGNQLFVTTIDGKLSAIDRRYGAINWIFPKNPKEILKSSRSSPSSDGNLVIYGCDNGYLYALDIDNGDLIWKYKTDGAIVSSPSICNDMVYFGSLDGYFYAVDVNDGKLIWKYDVGSKVYTSAAVSDSLVYIGGADGVLRCLNTQSGKLVWSFKAQSVFGSAPLISDSIVYIGSFDKKLYALNAFNGNLVWSYLLNGRIKSSPIIWNNYLLVFTDDKIISAFTPIDQEER